MTCYLDGAVKSDNTWSVAPGSGLGHLNIGAERTTSSNYVYKGMIDDLRIYNQVLDPNDVYPPVDGLPGLIGHWKMDEAGLGNIDVSACPSQTAIYIWSAGGEKQKWGQAADAFFRSISR